LTSFKSTLLRTRHKSYWSCIASQLSGDRPSAFDRRKAISGDTLLQPFNSRVRVDAETPRLCATLRTLMS